MRAEKDKGYRDTFNRKNNICEYRSESEAPACCFIYRTVMWKQERERGKKGERKAQ